MWVHVFKLFVTINPRLLRTSKYQAISIAQSRRLGPDGRGHGIKKQVKAQVSSLQLVMGDLSALCNNDRPKLASPGMATPISDYCLFIKAKVNGVANVEGRKRKHAYNTQPMGLLMRTLYRVMVQHRPSKELSKEFQNFCQTVLRRKRPIV